MAGRRLITMNHPRDDVRGTWAGRVMEVTDQNNGGLEQQPRRRGQGELEAQVLAALCKAPGAVTAAWVQKRLGGNLAYTTVMTILTRLHTKGVVVRKRVGRMFEWTAAADEAGLAALRMRKVLDAESGPGGSPGQLPHRPDAGRRTAAARPAGRGVRGG